MRASIHRMLRGVVVRLTDMRVEHVERLPVRGPAIVVANHNSHVDTALLLAAFPGAVAERVHPVAAADYWFRNRLVAWFSRVVLGAVPLDRTGGDDCLGPASDALARGDIVILFPEGTRGEPGRLGTFRSGVARLAAMHDDAVVVPVWLSGCDRVLPRHALWPRRWGCVARVGEPVCIVGGSSREDAARIRERVVALR